MTNRNDWGVRGIAGRRNTRAERNRSRNGNEMDFMEHMRSDRMLFYIHVQLRARACMWTNPEIEQSLPRRCTRFFKRVPFIQSTTICIYTRIWTFSRTCAGDFPPAGVQCKSKKNGKGRREKERNKGEEKENVFFVPETHVSWKRSLSRIANGRGNGPGNAINLNYLRT